MTARPKSPRLAYLFASAAVGIGAGGLWVAFNSRSETPQTPPPEPVAAPPLERAAPPPPAPATSPPPTPQGPTEVELMVKADAAGARMTFRRRQTELPHASTVKVSDIVELLEVSAPHRKTVRYWLTMDRPTTLNATLPPGRGLVEASELETLIALGEAEAPEATGDTPTAPVSDRTRTARKSAKSAAIASAPAVKAPRAVGSSSAANAAAATEAAALSAPHDAGTAAPPSTDGAPAAALPTVTAAGSGEASADLAVLRSSPSWMNAPAVAAQPVLSDAQIKRTMERYRGQVAACHDAAAADAASVTVTLWVSANGQVSRPQVKSTSSTPKLTGCILKSMATWKFPARKTGELQRASYTFALK